MSLSENASEVSRECPRCFRCQIWLRPGTRICPDCETPTVLPIWGQSSGDQQWRQSRDFNDLVDSIFSPLPPEPAAPREPMSFEDWLAESSVLIAAHQRRSR